MNTTDDRRPVAAFAAASATLRVREFDLLRYRPPFPVLRANASSTPPGRLAAAQGAGYPGGARAAFTNANRLLVWRGSARGDNALSPARRRGREKSDSAIVAVKPTNKAVPTAAEPVEPRAGAKGNARQQSTYRTQGRKRVAQALERVRQAARQRKKEKFTALLHHISIDCLRMAFFALKRRCRLRGGWTDVADLRSRP
jgi:hypothetical protein